MWVYGEVSRVSGGVRVGEGWGVASGVDTKVGGVGEARGEWGGGGTVQ